MMETSGYLIFIVVIVCLIFRNAFFTDYTDETKGYLQSIEREDSIDNVIPKTPTDLIQEKKSQSQTLSDLY
jgi:hypothetical protein